MNDYPKLTYPRFPCTHDVCQCEECKAKRKAHEEEICKEMTKMLNGPTVAKQTPAMEYEDFADIVAAKVVALISKRRKRK